MDVASNAVALNRWDRAGMLVSGACAVHCTLLPLLIAAIPVLGLGHLLDERVEWSFIISTGLVGTTAHLRAYWRDPGGRVALGEPPHVPMLPSPDGRLITPVSAT